MWLEKIIIELNSLDEEHLTSDNLKKIKRKYCKNNSISRIPTNIQILSEYRKMLELWEIEKNKHIENILRKRRNPFVWSGNMCDFH
jgi:histone acetyltransferase (RNA polymerase elongator complex component)